MLVRTEGRTGPAVMGDLRNDMMLILQLPWTIYASNLGLVNYSIEIPGPVGLGDSGPASVAIPGRPVQTSASKDNPGPVTVGDLRMVSSEQVSTIYFT